MRLRKTYDIRFKALDDATGYFEAMASVFGNVDFQGDVVMEGAYLDTLEAWRKSGDPIPVIWSHEWGDPFAHVGWADPNQAQEVSAGTMADVPGGGLLIRGYFDVDKAFAKQVYDLVKSRRVKEWSFAYDVVEEAPGKNGETELRKLDLIEVGPTLKGANPSTTTLAVKSDLEGAARAEQEAAVTRREVIDAALEIDPEIARHLMPVPPQTWDVAVLTDEGVVGVTAPVEDDIVEVLNSVAKSFKSGEKKPWRIEEQGDRFCVIKEEDGSTVACHDTLEEAEAHLRALYANEKETQMDVDEKDDELSPDEAGVDEKAAEAEGAKAGKVIGAKRVVDLSSRLEVTVREWADEVNGDLADEADDDNDDDNGKAGMDEGSEAEEQKSQEQIDHEDLLKLLKDLDL